MPSIPKGLSDEKATRALAALREGRTLRKFSIARNSLRFEAYCDAHPEYGQEARQLMEANAAAARLRKGHLRSRTHCNFGHPFSGENLLFGADGYRRCRTCVAKSQRENQKVSEQQARRVVDALNEGKTVNCITSGGTPSYIVNRQALAVFRQKHPIFDRFVIRRSAAIAKVHQAEVSARRARRLMAPAIAAQGADIFMLIRSAVPANLPAQIRDDVIGAMALEIVEGKLRSADISRRVRDYVTAQYRQFSKFGPVSLDARLFEDGNATLLDRISTEAGTGYWDMNMMASAGRWK